MSRRFSGSGHEIRLSAGASTAVGPFSFVVWAKFATIDRWNHLIGRGPNASPANEQFALRPDNFLSYYNGTDGNDLSSNALVANRWYLLGVTKANGTVAPVFHIYDTNTLSWSHITGPSAIANCSATIEYVNFGEYGWAGSDDFDGWLAAAAVYSSVLSNSEFETMENSLTAWIALSPAGLWVHDDSPVNDRTAGAANQTLVDGTTAAPTDNPPDFSFGVQMIRPDADIDATGWSTAPLWSKIDEDTPDGTVITSTAS